MSFPAPWRLQLQPATYNGVLFYVESQTRQGGFRLVPHEFPKKSIPWTEDMGRRVRHWSITGYLVYSPVHMPDVFGQRDALIRALETPGPGVLVLPDGMQDMSDEPPGLVHCDTFAITERREAGGWCSVDMIFVEAGQSPSSLTSAFTPAVTTSAAQGTTQTAMASTDITGVPHQGGAQPAALTGTGGYFDSTPTVQTAYSP